MDMKCSMLICTIAITVNYSFGANILAIQSMPFYSHQIGHYHFLKELIGNGHNLTIISPYLMDYGDENVKQFLFDGIIEERSKYSNIFEYKLKEMNIFTFIGINETKSEFKSIKMQFQNPIIQKLFMNSSEFHFDLLIYECLMCPFVALAEIYDCPLVLTLTIDPQNVIHQLLGNSYNPAIHSETLMDPSIHGQLKFFARIKSWIIDFFINLLRVVFMKISDHLLAKAFPDFQFPSQSDIMHRRLMLYYSFTTHITTNIRSTVPSYHMLGFSHIKAPSKLRDIKIKQFLDESINGVIIMCFGTVATELNDDLNGKFLQAFKELSYNVIWKIKSKDLEKFEIPKNILTVDWLQLDSILAHPNVKVLIAHAGLKTIEEAIDRQVPMVLIPVGYDQPFNANYQKNLQTATEIDLNKLTKESLKEAILEMMNLKYKENIKRVRQLAYDRMMSSLEDAVVNIEYLLKHNQTFVYQTNPLQIKSRYFSEFFVNIVEKITSFYLDCYFYFI